MLNAIHKKIMEDNIAWDSCSPAQRWVNTIILVAIVWFLLSSTSPLFAAAGLALFTYLIIVRLWFYIFIILWAWSLPKEGEQKEEEKEEEKEGESEE